MKKPFILIICLAVLFCIGGLATYEKRTEIDIHSGKVRLTKNVYRFTIKEQIIETEMSTILARQKRAERTPEWKGVYSFVLWNRYISPTYPLGGAAYDIDRIGRILRHHSINEARTYKLYDYVHVLLENQEKNRERDWNIMSHIESASKKEIEDFIDSLDDQKMSTDRPCPADLKNDPKSDTIKEQ